MAGWQQQHNLRTKDLSQKKISFLKSNEEIFKEFTRISKDLRHTVLFVQLCRSLPEIEYGLHKLFEWLHKLKRGKI